jgi:Flp pilus assembly pilin Flp
MIATQRLFTKKFAEDQSGTSVTEFGLIAFPISLMLMGTFDMGHSYYVKTVLNGALRDAARQSSLEGFNNNTQWSVIDNKLTAAVKTVSPKSTVKIDRRSYRTFADAAAALPEPIIVDLNSNGRCDIGENYMDLNGSSTWDIDGGRVGTGGARDVVIIQVTVQYKRLFPLDKMVGLPSNVQYISDSILANQPWEAQDDAPIPVSRPC